MLKPGSLDVGEEQGAALLKDVEAVLRQATRPLLPQTSEPIEFAHICLLYT